MLFIWLLHIFAALPPLLRSLELNLRHHHHSTTPRRLSFVTKETGYIISGLQPSSAYTVRVYSQSARRVRSRPIVMTFRTERAAPTPKPLTGFRVAFVNATVLRLAWDAPSLRRASSDDCAAIQIHLRDQLARTDWTANASCRADACTLPVRPNRRYRALAAVLDSSSGQSRPAMLSVQTPPARPSGSPKNFTAVPTAGGGALLSWLPPPPAARNGLLVAYEIRHRQLNGPDAESESVTVPGDRLNHRLAGLAPFGHYVVQVAARTVAGTGPFTPWVPFAASPAAHRGYQSAELRDPSQHSGDIPLPEKIRVKPTQVTAVSKRDSILLSWSRPSSIVIPDKYLIYYGTQLPKETLAGETSGDRDFYQIRNLKANQYYFITIVAVKDGTQAETTLHERTQSEAYDRQAPSVPLKVAVTVLDSRTAVVGWADRDLVLPGAEAAGRIYEVEWTEDVGLTGGVPAPRRRSNTTATRLRIANLRPHTAYSARVRCRLGYMVSEFSMWAIFTTKPEAPSSPPLDLKVTRASLPRSAQLSWLPPAEPNGRLTGYTVYYAADDRPDRRFVSRKTAAAETQIVVTGLRPATLYLFKVRAENGEGVGPATNLTMFMTPDANGYGGGMVLGAIGEAHADSPVQSASPTDPESDRKLWFVIGGGFALAILLLVVAIATVCVCRSGGGADGHAGRRHRRQAADRPGAKEEASLIGQDAPVSQRHPGSPRSNGGGGGGKNSPDAQAAALLMPAGQRQQQTPDLCRRSDHCLELRHLPPAGRGADGPVGCGGGSGGRGSLHPHLGSHLGLGGGRSFGDSLLIDPGASPNPSGHFRNISSSGLYPPGTPPYPVGVATASGVVMATAPGAGARGLASPPRVDAPDFSSGKLSSPHSSLSSSVGSPTKRGGNPTVPASLMLASLGGNGGGRANVTPDILNPVGRPGRSLQGPATSGGGGGGGGGGGSTIDSQTSRSFVLSTEDMTKTLDGLMNDLKSLTNKEFEC